MAQGRRTEVPLPAPHGTLHPSLVATRWLPLALVLVIAALLLVPATVRADDGPDGEARVAGRCTSGAASELRVRTRDDGELRIDLVLRSRVPRSAGWSSSSTSAESCIAAPSARVGARTAPRSGARFPTCSARTP